MGYRAGHDPPPAVYLVEEIPDDICCYCNKPADQKGLVLNGKPNCSHELEVAGRP
jgi:hypothetical protein